MLLTASLLVLLPGLVAAGANTPAGWTCQPLTQVASSHEDCVQSASYNNGVWDIVTQKVGTSQYRFCVITLSGAGVKVQDSHDFYVRATFTKSPSWDKPIGPYGGLSFNMEDADNGNYVMMRMLNRGAANAEIGSLQDGSKNAAMAKTTNNALASVTSGTATLEILRNGGTEDVWIGGTRVAELSDFEPFYVEPGQVGFAFQNAMMGTWGIRITDAEVCTVPCIGPDGTGYSVGDSYRDGDETCTCQASGEFECACGDTTPCPGGQEKWTDQDTCESKCIPQPAYCYSSGDPHYKTFDGKYYDFHGECTYQAASCGTFTVNFKNIDLHNRAPRYTRRLELVFKGSVFAIEAGWQSMVDGVAVQIPYVKTYTNGDRVEIVNNGQLEIRLYDKGRSPSVRLRATNYNTWINGEMWLHGSCADITEGLCGTWNGNSNDDLINNNPNTHGETYKHYDENCPAPPKPVDPCEQIGNLHDEAEAICNAMIQDPFRACNNVVDVGDREGGPMRDCMRDVCNCFIDESCACAQLDTYATQCINQGVDLANWRHDVAFCPYDCPAGQTYNPAGATPVPTCLNKDPEQTGTVRGCFCPTGQFLQDGVCVNPNQCKCLHEGIFFNNGDVFKMEGECKTCTCRDGGEMECVDDTCPELNCDDDQLIAQRDDQCCPFCLDNWVVAENPENQIKKGQKVILTCQVLVEGVSKRDIVWYKDGRKINKGISRDKLRLTVSNADADDDGTYTCEATKDGVTASDDFDVDVVMPAICEHADGTEWEEGTIYNPQETEECTCNAQGVHECSCIDDGEECEDPTPVAWFDDRCIKTCIPEPGYCAAAADPFYETFDGSQFAFKGDCKYNFFACGDVAMYADHEAEEASTRTKYLEVAFKSDTFKLEGNQVTLNGQAVTVPMHKAYKDGSRVSIEDTGIYALTITQDGKDPLVYLQWDKVSSYSIDVHGTCKGFSTGMCGKWDDNADNDMTGPDGTVYDNVEDFGTAWAEDDEADCPVPPEPEDMCDIMGLDSERANYERAINEIISSNPFKKCRDLVDLEEKAAQAVQEVCGCFGDMSCSCAILDQAAGSCKAAGVNTDGWQLNFPDSQCAPTCPEGSVFNAKGPKPAPSCAKPNGGRKTQAGCFCTDGKVLEDGVCIDVDECKCEYAGELYDVGDSYNKEGECLECTCAGPGDEQCEEMTCNTQCDDDEIEVEAEDECCPQCLADWVVAVNPLPDVEIGVPLELTCRVDGVEVSKDNVRWFRFDPGNKEITGMKRTYPLSDDGLTMTILNVDAKKEGKFKCVVEKDGKTSEGVFEVVMPAPEADLVEALQSPVNFVEGGNVQLECTKLEPVTELWWTCNGERVENRVGNVVIRNTKAYSRLNFKPATLENMGTCTCHARGLGSEDSAEIEVGGAENEVTITRVEEEVTCQQGKKSSCKLEFTVDTTIGKVGPRDVKICLLKNGNTSNCVNSKLANDVYSRSFGKQRKPKSSGDYVAVVTVKGIEYTSEPISLTITPKQKKEKKEKKKKKKKGE